MRTDKTITLIGAPSDIGAGHRGGSMGPEALRVAGIAEAIEGLGHRVLDRGNLAGPVNPWARPQGGYRHLEETALWCRAIHDRVYDDLKQGHLPVLMGGDHALAIGSIAAAARHCGALGTPLTVLWLDAHADFNTPETTPSGNIHGMPAAVLTGTGPEALTSIGATSPIIPSERIIQLGVRSVDAKEKRRVLASDLVVYDMRHVDEHGMRVLMERVLAEVAQQPGHLHVSFDVDFLDPAIAPGVGTTVSGGPSYREAQLCMEMIWDCGLMASLDIVELNPAFDDRNLTAELVVELVASLFGKQILTRRPELEKTAAA